MGKTVRFYYVRHGKTLFNRLGRMQGWCDAPLEEEGIAQAYAANEALKDVPFDRAYTSTSERCVDTAHIVLEGRDVPLTYTKLLKEMFWGDYEGARDVEYPEEIKKRRFGNADWSDCGGENLQMLKERVLKIYGQIYDESNDGDNVLIVSHGAIFMHMVQLVFGLNRKYMYQLMEEHGEKMHPITHGYAGIFEIQDGEYRLLQLNGHYDGFLDDLKAYGTGE